MNNFLYRKKYEEPSQAEGFSAVVKINFIPKFNDPALDRLYKMYLLEK
jgi:bifunctional polynucleotide phosphatase/kinase